MVSSLQGDEADCMFFVESGVASIRIRNQVQTPPSFVFSCCFETQDHDFFPAKKKKLEVRKLVSLLK